MAAAARRKKAEAGLKQVAEYLGNTVGVGGVFTIPDLRRLVPSDNQIDRRMRDLRKCGWQIDNSQDDPTLGIGQYRVVVIGGTKMPKSAISGATRRRVFDRDDYTCVLCGFSRGDTYPDRPGKVRLTVGHIVAREHGGSDDLSNLRTECARCNEESRDLAPDSATGPALVSRAKNLSRADKRQLAAWLRAGKRDHTDAEALWAILATSSPEVREQVAQALANF